MKQVSKIDANGFYMEPIVIEDGEVLTEPVTDANGNVTYQPRKDIVTTAVPEGLHHPKWNGSQWVEGLNYFILTSTPVASTPNTYNITATLSNILNTSLSNVTFTIASTPIIQSFANNQANITIQLHKVVANLKNPIIVSAEGCTSGTINIGGNGLPSQNVKAVIQTDNSVLIKNTSKQEITNYYMLHTVSQSDIETDMANLLDLYGDMLNKLMNWTQNASYSPLVLTDNEKNSVTQFGSSYIPNIRLKLEDASPLGSTPQNPRYPNIVNHKQQANSVANEYLQVVSDPDVK